MTGTCHPCNRGGEVSAVYVADLETSVADLVIKKRQISPFVEPAASAMRHAWPSESSGHVWPTKGYGAVLLWADGEAGTETVPPDDCKLAFCKPPPSKSA